MEQNDLLPLLSIVQALTLKNGQHLPFISFIIYITISMRESMFILGIKKGKI